MEYEERVQLIMLGESNSGKTSLTHKYASGFFTNQSIPTIGIEYINKKVNVDGKNFRVKIWDTAGQERYKSLTKNFFRNADGVALVYDITDRNSFDKIKTWIHSVNESVNMIKMILMGNKIDLYDERTVSKEEGEKLAAFYNLPFFETSAKENIGVDEAYDKLISDVIEEIKNLKKKETIDIDNSENSKSFYSCCI